MKCFQMYHIFKSQSSHFFFALCVCLLSVGNDNVGQKAEKKHLFYFNILSHLFRHLISTSRQFTNRTLNNKTSKIIKNQHLMYILANIHFLFSLKSDFSVMDEITLTLTFKNQKDITFCLSPGFSLSLLHYRLCIIICSGAISIRQCHCHIIEKPSAIWLQWFK